MKNSKKKIIFIGILAAVALIFVLMFVSSSSPGSNSSVAVLPSPSGALSDQKALLTGENVDIVRMLNLLRGVSFENVVLFDGEAFNSLIDFSVSLPTSEAGKSNPFSSK
ncbi:TPA: hypothetical protein DEW47_01930 [Patescibacteria group bacterium]|nr:MAG: hypothetical protein UT71_C0002G0062 [Parcubacteria group bacterium GW2011_GWF2_40_10]KKR47839.1 MAG: hypothetical protein UT83_C0003G0052 [Parcubacteria group bacterium GW2011_GWA2_40_143]KKR60270.1 MAG: hypothetical protein UT97_C0003G0052 [Parcubacteria group bacterium GW2011_GWC2_40_31]KKR75235.1 MAG: hypothetical protein UU18_C0010G0011 [Parcubacteria group bacterium GW2011_GWB2_40_8]KKR77442.1 MAG: hypothetical protein UU20_C0007G0012 [Parcubacteria group bacterium GW2011_GWE2_40_